MAAKRHKDKDDFGGRGGVSVTHLVSDPQGSGDKKYSILILFFHKVMLLS